MERTIGIFNSGSNGRIIYLEESSTKEELFNVTREKYEPWAISADKVFELALNAEKSNAILDHVPNEMILEFPNLKKLTISSPSFQDFTSIDLVNIAELSFFAVSNSRELKKLTQFPPAKWEVLNLDRNAIDTIEDLTFSRLGALEYLWLDQNRLTEISRNTFAGLSKLLKLALQENRIHTIEDGAFTDLEKLYQLNLSQNRLKTLTDHTFDGLVSIELLFLKYNQINRIGRSLYPLTTSESILLSNNPIEDIDLIEFAKMPKLRILHLQKTGLRLENFTASSEFSTSSKVRHLDLSYNNIRSVEFLRIFPDLYDLDVSYSDGTKETPEERKLTMRQRIRAILPKLEDKYITV